MFQKINILTKAKLVIITLPIFLFIDKGHIGKVKGLFRKYIPASLNSFPSQ